MRNISMVYLNIIFHRIAKDKKDIKDLYEVTLNQFIDIVKLLRRLKNSRNSLFDDFRLYFDDGDDTFLTRAMAILTQPELKKCILAITTNNIGMPGFMNDKDLILLKKRGVKISAHGVSHASLAYYQNGVIQPTPKGGEYRNAPFGHTRVLTAREVLFQLVEAKKMLSGIVGPITEFVLPHGCYNEDVLKINTKNNIYEIVSTCDEYLDDNSILRPRILTRHDMSLSELENKIERLKPLNTKQKRKNKPRSYSHKEVRKMQKATLPCASFLFVTYNRCPSTDFNNNPLTWAFETLIANPMSKKITQWVVVSDGSTDNTRKNIDWLRKKYNLNIKTKYCKSRKGCSFRRSQGIKLLTNDLFFMGDDDCLYREDFIGASLYEWQRIWEIDKKIAVLAQPVFEMSTSFMGKVNKSKVGWIDFNKAWFYHNFDKKVYQKSKVVKNSFAITTFTGVTLGSRRAFLKAGNFKDLSNWDNDYSEHLEMSHKLNKSGYTMYYLPNELVSVTHIAWGRPHSFFSQSNMDIVFFGINKTLGEIELASQKAKKSGCRVSPRTFILNRIGSFLSFYLKVDPASATKYALLEYKSLVCNKYIPGTPEEIKQETMETKKHLWKKAILLGMMNAQEETGELFHLWYNSLLQKIENLKVIA